MISNLKSISVFFLGIFATFNVAAQDANVDVQRGKIYIKPYGGFIGIQKMNLKLVTNTESNNIEVENDFGWTSGIAIGYHITNSISTEIGWEYKTNNVTVLRNNIKSYGDYASNFIYLNGLYNFTTKSRWKPYAGFGVALIQEIDIDFGDAANSSFSNSGNLGIQGITGVDFNFSKRWALNWEAKYVTFRKFEMKNEANDNQLKNLKYNPFIFNIGIKFIL
jgi:outer membrane protein W